MARRARSEGAIPPQSATDHGYEFVKERLLDGRYAGGRLLSENQLAKRLGISRTPVRQAFLQLEAEELLDLYLRRGALVRPVSASEANDVLEARLLIETHCMGRVAAASNTARIERFVAEHREIVAALERRDPRAAVRLTRAHLRGAPDVFQRPRL